MGSFRYQPWWATAWHDYRTAILESSGALALLAGYLGAIGMMLWLVPARLASIGAAAGIDEIKKPEGNLGVLTWPAPTGHREPGASLVHPSPARTASVDASCMSTGKARIEQLSKSARESFLNETDFLDAWVTERLGTVCAALDHLDLVRQRRVYVALPDSRS